MLITFISTRSTYASANSLISQFSDHALYVFDLTDSLKHSFCTHDNDYANSDDQRYDRTYQVSLKVKVANEESKEQYDNG